MPNRRLPCFAGLILLVGGIQGLAAEPASLSALDATRSRPLFSPTRRPAPPPVVADEVPEPIVPVVVPPPNVEVRGIIIGDGSRVAIVKRRQDASANPISVGAKIDGWTLAAIDQRTIVLRLGSRTVTVAMPEPGR